MADVSLDDLIKQDREKNKANRLNKVLLSLFRSLPRKKIHKERGFRTTIIKAVQITSSSVNKMSLVLSKRNSLKKTLMTTGILPGTTEKKRSRSHKGLEKRDPRKRATKNRFEL